MPRILLRSMVGLCLLAFISVLAGCATDTEVSRTKLPSIDKTNEKNK